MCGRITLTTKPSRPARRRRSANFELGHRHLPRRLVAEEDRAEGEAKIAPYWRVIKDDGSLNEKFPGGVAWHAKLLEGGGHAICAAGKRQPRVADFEKRIVK